MRIIRMMRSASIASLSTTVLFVVFTLTAMVVYDGGTTMEPTHRHYQFWFNFFSDLGRTRTFAGSPQPLPRFLFSTALIVMGIMMIPQLVLLPFMMRKRAARAWATIASASGTIAGLGYVGVACTPWDRYLDGHMLFVRTAFLALLVLMSSTTVALVIERSLARIHTRITGLFSLLAGAYVLLLFFGPGAGTVSGRMIQCAGQKIIVYSGLFTLGVFSWGLVKKTSE